MAGGYGRRVRPAAPAAEQLRYHSDRPARLSMLSPECTQPPVPTTACRSREARGSSTMTRRTARDRWPERSSLQPAAELAWVPSPPACELAHPARVDGYLQVIAFMHRGKSIDGRAHPAPVRLGGSTSAQFLVRPRRARGRRARLTQQLMHREATVPSIVLPRRPALRGPEHRQISGRRPTATYCPI